MAILFVLCLAAALRPAILQESNLPKTWKICKRSDPNLNGCLKTAISAAFNELRPGNLKLGVPPVEPMHFHSITLDQGYGPVGITLKLTNLFIHGLSRIVIDKVRVDYSNYRYDIDFHVEGSVNLRGDYTSNGKVLVIPIKGTGKCNMTFEDFSGRISIKGNLERRNGQQYLRITKTDISIETTRLHINFVRTKQETISKILNKFLNENWKDILNDLKPAISNSFGENIQEIANDVFLKIPFDLIAPP